MSSGHPCLATFIFGLKASHYAIKDKYARYKKGKIAIQTR